MPGWFVISWKAEEHGKEAEHLCGFGTPDLAVHGLHHTVSLVKPEIVLLKGTLPHLEGIPTGGEPRDERPWYGSERRAQLSSQGNSQLGEQKKDSNRCQEL